MRQQSLYFACPQALLQVNPDLSDPSTSLLIQVYLSDDADTWHGAIRQFIQQHFPNACVVGITCYGQFQHTTLYRSGLMLQLTWFDSTQLTQCVLAGNISKAELLRSVEHFIQPDTAVVLVYSANQNDQYAELLPLLSSLRPDIQIAGALAVPAGPMLNARVFCQQALHQVGVVLVAFNSVSLSAAMLLKQNWFPIGKPLLINEASHHVISKIDGVSVAELYQRYLGVTAAKYLPAASSVFPLLIDDGVEQTTTFVIKALSDGSAVFNKSVRTGQFVRLSFADMNTLLENDYLAQSQPVPGGIAMVFSCGGRFDLLKDNIVDELTPIATQLPTAGCFGFGEIAMAADGKARLFSHSMATLFLAEQGEKISFCKIKAPEPERNNFELTTSELLRVYNNLTKALMADLTESNQALLQMSQQDHLTKIANRNFLDQVLAHQYHLYTSSQQACSVLLLDIDHFKKVNDQYGHLAGDIVLQQVAATLKAHSRGNDVVGRWGGEEFLVICPGCELSVAMQIAERIRLAVAELGINSEAGIIRCTLSGGVASFSDGQTVDDLLREADMHLYRAKADGRNKVYSRL